MPHWHSDFGAEELLRQAAKDIGHRLLATALREGGACRWNTVVQPPRPGRSAVYTVDDPWLYQGGAGIALFLAELYGVTGETTFADAAHDTLRTVAAKVRCLPTPSPAFFSGTTGVAYVAMRVFALTGEEEMADIGRELLIRTQRLPISYRALDVITGPGGAIPALLAIRHFPGCDAAFPLARRMGEHLLSTADRYPWGWCWETSGSTRRGLTGFSHGAAGIGNAMFELAAATGDPQFHFAGEQAFAYERRYLNRKTGNWPDFRVGSLSEVLANEGVEALKARVRAGETFTAPADRAMFAWCHGAPGIALARLRAWQLFKSTETLDDARIAVTSTRAAFSSAMSLGYSLCHGVAGNCETLLVASEVWEESEPRRWVIEHMIEAASRFGAPSRHWPSGVHGGAPDSSLMTGDAGIGHLLLRAADPRIPSILLVPTGEAPDEERIAAVAVDRVLAEAEVACQLPWTVRIVGRLLDDAPALCAEAIAMRGGEAPSVAVDGAVRARLTAEPDLDLRERLVDACRFDACRLELLEVDATLLYVEEVAHENTNTVNWREGRWRLSAGARVFRWRWRWPEWLADDSALPVDEAGALLLCRRNNAVESRPLGDFAAVVLDALASPATVNDLLVRIGDRLEQSVDKRLREATVAQLVAAHAAGIVVREWQDDDAVPAAESMMPASLVASA